MTDVLEIIREPAGEPVVEFEWAMAHYRLRDGEVYPTLGFDRAVLRADRIRRGEEPPADGFELKQEQGKITEIRRADGTVLWRRLRDGRVFLRENCTDEEFIAIADILKEKRDG